MQLPLLLPPPVLLLPLPLPLPLPLLLLLLLLLLFLLLLLLLLLIARGAVIFSNAMASLAVVWGTPKCALFTDAQRAQAALPTTPLAGWRSGQFQCTACTLQGLALSFSLCGLLWACVVAHLLYGTVLKVRDGAGA